MKIDWKYVATTEGYKSLKAAYIHDVQDAEHTRSKGRRPMRDKAEFLRKFKWVISRATYHANYEGVTIDVILDRWEVKRNYWWLNYYGDYKSQSKYSPNKLKPMGIKGLRNSYKKDVLTKDDPVKRKHRIFREILRKQKDSSTKSPKRWDSDRRKW